VSGIRVESEKEEAMQVARSWKAVVIILVLMAATAGAQQGSFFPLGAAGPATASGISYLAEVESLGGNWAWIDCGAYGMHALQVEQALWEAHGCSLKILLSNAGIRPESTFLNIANFADGKFHNYESDSLIVHDSGDVDAMKAASDSAADCA
jgi:hypothetical protein